MMGTMKSSLMVLAAMFVLSFVVLTFGQATAGHSDLQGIEAKALAYIENVLPLDFARYNITYLSYQLPEAPNATYREDAVTFTLNSSESTLTVNCLFRDGIQHTCDMRVQKGSPIYNGACSNLVGVVRSIIEKHQAQIGVDSTELLRTLDRVDSAEEFKAVTLGNLTLTVSQGFVPTGLKMVNGSLHVDPSNTHGVTSFKWQYTSDGSYYVPFFIDFENGNFHSLRDERLISGVSSSGQEETGLQSEPPSFPLVPFAAASASGIVACLGVVFYFKKRGSSKEPIANSASQSW
jgi:hypothetical protein